MTTTEETARSAMKLALEALETGGWNKTTAAITALREALASQGEALASEAIEQPAQQQEPVAWRVRCTDPTRDWVLMYRYPKTEERFSNIKIQPLYTSPPAQRTWVGLTDEEIWAMDAYTMAITDQETRWLYRLARAIEAKLKAKNSL